MTELGDAIRRLGDRQKPARGVSLYSRWVNRPLGRVAAAVGYTWRATPNAVSAISAAVTATGIVLLVTVPPTPLLGLLVYLLFATGFVLDSADGQLARLLGGGSPAGEWLDHVLDCAKTLCLHLAVLVGWYRFGGLDSPLWLVVPLVFQVAAMTSFFAGILVDQLVRRAAGPASRPGAPSTVRSVLLLPADYGVLCLAFLTLGFPDVFRWVYTLLAVLRVGLTAGLLLKWWRLLARVPGTARSGGGAS